MAGVPCSVSRETLPPALRAGPWLETVQATYGEQFRGMVADPDHGGPDAGTAGGEEEATGGEQEADGG